MDWQTFTPRDACADVQTDKPGIYVFAARDDAQAVVYLLPSSRESPGMVTVTLRGLAPGQCRVHLWEPRTGQLVTEAACCCVGDDAALRISLPPLQSDLALAVTRAV